MPLSAIHESEELLLSDMELSSKFVVIPSKDLHKGGRLVCVAAVACSLVSFLAWSLDLLSPNQATGVSCQAAPGSLKGSILR